MPTKKHLRGMADESVKFSDEPRLINIRVKDAYKLLWNQNPKNHDLNKIAASLTAHGFQELPKYDATLRAIKAGNGRIEALYMMEKLEEREIPRGVGIDKNDNWVMKLLIGVDAPSLAMAKAYAIDSNNLTMAGFEHSEIAKMWDPEDYAEILRQLDDEQVYPVSAAVDEIKDFLALLDPDFEPVPEDEVPRLDVMSPVTCPECGHIFIKDKHH